MKHSKAIYLDTRKKLVNASWNQVIDIVSKDLYPKYEILWEETDTEIPEKRKPWQRWVSEANLLKLLTVRIGTRIVFFQSQREFYLDIDPAAAQVKLEGPASQSMLAPHAK